MKVKCVKNSRIKKIIFGVDFIIREALTLGKVYDVEVIVMASSIFFGTEIDFSDNKFLVFADNKQWEYFPFDYFEPIREE